jgi:hypothetical protein
MLVFGYKRIETLEFKPPFLSYINDFQGQTGVMAIIAGKRVFLQLVFKRKLRIT